MTGVILYFGLALVVLALLDWFPPTSLLVRPLLQGLFKAAGGLIDGLWRYGVIFIKALLADHVAIVRHLTLASAWSMTMRNDVTQQSRI